jgi:UDP-N-acetylglucosamine acyltransferase
MSAPRLHPTVHANVHPTAIVDPRAELAADVQVGPYAIVDAGVILGPGCVLHAHAIVRGPTVLGPRNVVHPFAVVGGEPQAKRHAGGPARLECGAGNVLREHVTVHGGTEGRTTRLGDDNLLMVGAHVAHDVVMGSGCVLANGVQLAGHVVVEDRVTFGGLSGVAQFVRVGESAFVAAMSACERDVPPFVVVAGNRAQVRGVNAVGLRRRGVPEESVRALSRAVRALTRRGTTRAEALRSLEAETDSYVVRLLEALRRQGRD